MKTIFVLLVLFLSAFMQAQDTLLQNKSSDICSHGTNETPYYDWDKIESAFAKRVNIPVYKCYDFFVYAFSEGYLSMKEYRELVKSGSVTQHTAMEYWLAKLPLCEEIYKKEYQSYLSAKQNAGGHNSIMTSCNNLDFGTGTTANWTGEWNNQGTSGTINGSQGYGNITVNGFNSGSTNSMSYVHEICTAGNDPNVPISRVPPGHTYSIRIGSDSAYRQNAINPNVNLSLPFFHQKISNTFLVTATNKIISYWYAVCLTQNSSNPHPQSMQPYFKIRMYDGVGNEIVCARYDVDATTADFIGGFQSVIVGPTELLYKDWTQLSIPLLNYVGQNVTITFETSDCAGGGHSGIAYLAVDCLPLSDIQVVTNPCNATKTLIAPPGMASYSWSGTGTMSGATNQQSVTVTSAGTFSVAITTIGNSGFVCNLNLNTTVTAPAPLPIATFTSNIVCSGNATQFTDISTTNGDTISGWNWSFGDGASSNLFNPSHTYASGGNFPVSYTITTNHGCTFSHNDTAIVRPTPLAAFTTAPVCLASPSVFSNTSSTGNSYSWDFGDGIGTSALQAPQYTYNSVGTYSVLLTVTSPYNCIASVTHNAIVKPIPSLVITSPLPVCSGVSIPVPSYTITPNNPATTFSWINNNTSIGLSTNGFGMIPSFIAASNTTISNNIGTVTIVPTLNGCTGPPVPYIISIKPTPTVTHANINLCPAQNSGNIVFTANPNTVPASNILWTNTNPSVQIGISATNGFGSIPAFTSPTIITTAQSNVITLQANLNGCTGPTSTFTISANPNPVADFSFPNVCEGNPVIFIDHSTIGSGAVNQWGWDMDNNGTYLEATTQNPSYLFNQVGYHTVGLQATSNKGCTDTIHKTIYVNPSPVISFNGDTASCTPLNTVLSGNISISPPQYIQSHTWNLGNGSSPVSSTNASNTTTIATSYTNNLHTQNAYYSPSLQAVTNIGCTTTLTKNKYIIVYPNPKADFTWTPEFADLIDPTINFFDQSEGAAGANAYNWNFGDVFSSQSIDNASNYSNLANPIHKYNDQISYAYSITQVVQNTHSCTDSIKKELTIHPAVTFYIPNAFSPNGDGKNEGFKGTGIGIDNSTYNLWIFNRWGEMIFHAEDLEKSWDGRYEGNKVQEDTYIWKVDFKDVFGKQHQHHGRVTVVR